MDIHLFTLVTAPLATPATVALLYLGPETIMPLGSFLAATLGVLLLFWRQTMAMARNGFRKVFVRRGGDYSRMDGGEQVQGRGKEELADRVD